MPLGVKTSTLLTSGVSGTIHDDDLGLLGDRLQGCRTNRGTGRADIGRQAAPCRRRKSFVPALDQVEGPSDDP